MLLSFADEKIKGDGFVVNGWNVTYDVPVIDVHG
jgi:hypothetical protein